MKKAKANPLSLKQNRSFSQSCQGAHLLWRWCQVKATEEQRIQNMGVAPQQCTPLPFDHPRHCWMILTTAYRRSPILHLQLAQGSHTFSTPYSMGLQDDLPLGYWNFKGLQWLLKMNHNDCSSCDTVVI